jgi:VanZ family protein
MFKATGARLFGTLLGYVILIILLLTLNPFYFSRPEEIVFNFYTGRSNLINNILLFLPVGFLYRLTTKKRGAVVFGAGLSFSIEITQFFIPARTPSIPDILANAVGAGLGALFYDLLSTRIIITQGVLGRLRLETPLMGLIYLFVPLLWINMLALGEAPHRWLLSLLLGICGAIIFSNLFRHWSKTIDFRIVGFASLAAGSWFLIGAGPTLLPSIPILIIGLGVMVLTAMLTMVRQPSADRRYERNTLKLLLPVLVPYLLLLTLFFPLRPLGSWHAIFGFTDSMADTSLQSLYPRVEHLAAFTVLGYIIAEWRGRLELSLREDLPGLLLIAACFALALEFLSGFQSGRGASLVRLVLSVTGSLCGGTIYHMSRAHIRFLLGR